MSKPTNIPIENKPYFGWKYEEQTVIKHRVFKEYWRVWVSKLGRNSDTLLFDCHAGCGVYINADNSLSFGSSIIADKIATEINNNSSRLHKNYICACDVNQENLENLKSAWQDCSCSNRFMPKLSNYNDILQNTQVMNFYRSHPTLFFVDPFGYYNTPMQGMANLLKGFGNEILINFMFDFLNRGISISAVDEKQLTDFFGCKDWKKARDKSGEERELFLVRLYCDKLKEYTFAKFVFPYKLSYPNKNQTYYYLIHATNNIEGITHMKNSFAKINHGRVEYLGKKQDDFTIFDLDSYKSSEIAQQCFAQFVGKTIAFNSLWEQIVESVPFIKKDLQIAIADFEEKSLLSVKRISSKRGRYRDEDLITFGDKL